MCTPGHVLYSTVVRQCLPLVPLLYSPIFLECHVLQDNLNEGLPPGACRGSGLGTAPELPSFSLLSRTASRPLSSQNLVSAFGKPVGQPATWSSDQTSGLRNQAACCEPWLAQPWGCVAPSVWWQEKHPPGDPGEFHGCLQVQGWERARKCWKRLFLSPSLNPQDLLLSLLSLQQTCAAYFQSGHCRDRQEVASYVIAMAN